MRVVGYLLLVAGLVLALAAIAFRSPMYIGLNRYSVEVWILGELISFALVLLGMVMLFRSAH